jgi:hypothetical protein
VIPARCVAARPAPDLLTKAGNRTFRATSITAYLTKGGTLEKAVNMANHASTRATQFYHQRSDAVALDEIEQIVIWGTYCEGRACKDSAVPVRIYLGDNDNIFPPRRH